MDLLSFVWDMFITMGEREGGLRLWMDNMVATDLIAYYCLSPYHVTMK